ncbi:MAG TPA: DNA polymerase I, partial [Alphaproteobacteria bacterium]|nr:DNA polymerase I [Alphaproteobacteria bacterium]
DDLIATYAKLARDQNIEVLVVSSDKDLMQLVREGVSLMDPMKQIRVGHDQVMEKFGVPPEKVIDVQALCGDSIDNVPGVPGIGVKTAAQLITEYGTLENLLSKTEEIKQPKRRESLETNADLARISKQLVTLKDDVQVEVAVDDLKPSHPFSQNLKSFLEHQGFKSLLARIKFEEESIHPHPDLPPSRGKESCPPPLRGRVGWGGDAAQYKLILSASELESWIEDANETGLLAFDTETTGLTPAMADLVGISLSTRAGRACYIPLAHGKKTDLLSMDSGNGFPPQPDVKEIGKILAPVFADRSIVKIGHNAKFDLQMIKKAGIETIHPLEDTMLLSYVLDGTAHGHGLDELAMLMCGHKMISYDEVTGTGKSRISFAEVPLDKACDYAAEDADFTFRLYEILKPRIAPGKMARVYEDIERPLVPVIADMEENGIKVDPNILRQLSQNFADRLLKLEEEIHKEAGHPFNIGSPKQLGVVLFEEMGLKGGSKTKTGDWSTAADVLEGLAEENPFAQKILDWRHLSKLRSTYTESLQSNINPKTGRVHTSFSMALTNTGRLSSSDPNLQNIPIRTEEGRLIRTAFVAEKGHVLLSADYSQIELRLVAELAGIEALKTSFLKGEDIHARTASEVMGIPLEDITPDLRRKAKAINFGIIYGISGFGLAKQLDCPVSEASAYIRTYMERFPELNAFMEKSKEEARKFGHVKTIFGRKCVISGISEKNPARRNFAERQAINAPLQGTAADLIKLAMIRVDRLIKGEKLPMKLLLQVHDELVLEVPADRAEEMAALIKGEMEKVAAFSVPLKAETGWAENWADAH